MTWKSGDKIMYHGAREATLVKNKQGGKEIVNALAEIILVKDDKLNHLQTLEKFDFSALPIKGDFLRVHPYNHLEVIERHILYYPDFAKVEIFVEDHSINAAISNSKETVKQDV